MAFQDKKQSRRQFVDLELPDHNNDFTSPTAPYSPFVSPHDHQNVLGSSKRDLWAYEENSLFSTWNKDNDKKDPGVDAPPKASKNSIFDTPQTIMKPALKMTEQELAELRSGQVPSTQSQSSEPYSYEPSRTSITVPVTRQVHVDDSHGDLKSLHTNNTTAASSIQPKPLSVLLPSTTGLQKATHLPPTEQQPQQSSYSSATSVTNPALSDDLQLMFFPIRKNFLGEGRYAQVFLGSYNIIDRQKSMLASSWEENDPLPCAVKRYHATSESQAVGLAELFILRRLQEANHPNLIGLIGAKDEGTELETPGTVTKPRQRTSFSNIQRPPEGTIGDPSPRLLLVLELCSGGTLYGFIRKNPTKIGRRVWMKFARQLASALACIHGQGLIHHDIKPHNCLLTDVLDLKLADFGNAAFVDDGNMPTLTIERGRQLDSPSREHLTPSPIGSSPTRSSAGFSSTIDGVLRGTQPYSAPELFSQGEYSFPIDVYSVGVTLFFCINGVDPFSTARTSMSLIMSIKKGFFESGLQRDVGPEGPLIGGSQGLRFSNGELVSQDIANVIISCVSRDPASRPTAVELIRRLETIDNYTPVV
ncbi:hypothetical protein SmJEL517_g06049 [Synchytrium microbalum]|uniref:non-specific serine/threonine protein kinase n=1 Tax=Synchytrium microbalum TaxID=1806994 RepID=A0A507BTD6_9FUNG|nr:uncharacterized protein SmJEL517_g06049 [Synchytrium microbalum]TPX30359.1 hypothetical protein SmJEL517_g06049 [Synchytrium microbalum]